ncbi:DUF4838 domain-containing protein [Sphingobacterium tabacisoli]|uniref:DUF4838 domain-containing protein n=1 Tax=Sphingobacterium tabacisoli TaxID=2044855 RepID=A0ABW5L3T6_9SPHI|nr:DUF4838 domain-containing protein [Sphingobacterium tabacisoli]
MFRFKQIVWLWGIFCLLSSSCKARTFDFATPRLLILSNGDKESIQAADYLFQHLDKRNTEKAVLQIKRSDTVVEGFEGGIVYVEIVEDLGNDYEIINEEGRLSLFGRDRAILRWLSYMLIDRLGDYHRLKVADIPPGYLDFKTGKVDFAFKYRDPHLQPNMNQDISGILLTHNVDRDWGLWGHNLRKVFVGGIDTDVMALVDGRRDAEQYCFSSEKAYQAIKTFVLEEYGRGPRDARWFMIAPNDNDKVCSCASCRKQGNTAKSATAAVVVLLNRLTKEFPQDYFYTTAYRTTREAPKSRLADHAGVLLSTIDLPKSPQLDVNAPSVREFSTLLESWKQQTSQIYLWDYISNFDDYITPFPVLRRVQGQLVYFSKIGVDGVFLNGSGYDYSPFDDVKTYVLSAIMIDPSLSVSDLVKRYHQRFYPISADVLSSYLLEIEDNLDGRNSDLAIYSSFRESMKSYLKSDRFNKFYAELTSLSAHLEGDEALCIRKLLHALSYTKLQVDYHDGDIANGVLAIENNRVQFSSQNDVFINRLHESIEDGVTNYKEEKGSLEVYLNEWKRLKKTLMPMNRFKVSKGIGLSSSELLDEAFLLSDNKTGFVSDFNQGWLLAGEDVSIIGRNSNKKQGSIRLELRFLLNARHRMYIPDRLELWAEGTRMMVFSASDFVILENVATLKKDIDLLDHTDLEIKIYKNKELKNSVIACDEIQLY